ncbi:MAG TPA: hypothetical protein VD997_01285 [Phycisphaerales bacterium]|nr:hypothetical protein [Phycisphaerales bacterium]
MKFTIAAIVLVAAGLAVAVAREGHASWADIAILGVAVISVCVFGALPVVVGRVRPPRRRD